MKQQNLSIDLLRIDGGTQSRLAINEEVVESYAELIAESKDWPFPPLDVFHDGTDYYVADGFHRKLGAVKAKRASVPCNVHEGTATDAHIFGMTANDRHGLRMTRADKRACVEWLLDNPPRRTQAEVAELSGVSARWVRQIVADRNADSVKGKMKTNSKGGSSASPTSTGSCSSYTPESGSSEPSTPPATTEPTGVDRAHEIDTNSGGGGDDPLDFPEGPPADLGTPDDWQDEKPKKGKKPPVSGPDTQALYKEWDRAIGPLVRLVDRIAGQVNGKHGDHHKLIQEHLNVATEEMMEWMGVAK